MLSEARAEYAAAQRHIKGDKATSPKARVLLDHATLLTAAAVMIENPALSL